jgi:hypothetical protein
MRSPFADGATQQGDQSPKTPAAWYRQALAALDKYCRATHAGSCPKLLAGKHPLQAIKQPTGMARILAAR